jgi:hypothetical protein
MKCSQREDPLSARVHGERQRGGIFLQTYRRCVSLEAGKGIENLFDATGNAPIVEDSKQVIPHGVFAQVELKCSLLVPHLVATLLAILK